MAGWNLAEMAANGFEELREMSAAELQEFNRFAQAQIKAGELLDNSDTRFRAVEACRSEQVRRTAEQANKSLERQRKQNNVRQAVQLIEKAANLVAGSYDYELDDTPEPVPPLDAPGMDDDELRDAIAKSDAQLSMFEEYAAAPLVVSLLQTEEAREFCRRYGAAREKRKSYRESLIRNIWDAKAELDNREEQRSREDAQRLERMEYLRDNFDKIIKTFDERVAALEDKRSEGKRGRPKAKEAE